MNTPIQDTHYTPAWPRPVHHRLAVQEQPYIRQRPGNKDINVNAIRTAVAMSVCTSVEDIQVATHEDTHL